MLQGLSGINAGVASDGGTGTEHDSALLVKGDNGALLVGNEASPVGELVSEQVSLKVSLSGERRGQGNTLLAKDKPVMDIMREAIAIAKVRILKTLDFRFSFLVPIVWSSKGCMGKRNKEEDKKRF